ncbi:hypothetical protein AK88_05142 [Plasmodium fragile]|uniref:Circumsporozoite protein n=1 Tax=Plasmodium fragile TaxID=5857 RepID=A0A0D9QDT8_PLAFR|nr:uncharacterized protein AK88_05142 [Plasmodium fragile]KJP85215.1 hypothetical protein AK88_05142 [Plasmodium fragile]
MKNFILLAVSSILLMDLFPTHCGHNVDLSNAINLNGVSLNNVDVSSLGSAQVRQSASRGRVLGENPKEEEGADKQKKKKEKEVEPKKPRENKLKQPVVPAAGGDADRPAGGDAHRPAGGDADRPAGGDADRPAAGGDADRPAGGDADRPAGPAAGQNPANEPQRQENGGGAQPAGGNAGNKKEGDAGGNAGNKKEGDAGGNAGGNAGAGKGQGQNNEGANKVNEKLVKEYLEKIRSSVGTEWTPCSVTCGTGVRIRRKADADKKKPEELTLSDLEMEACTMDKCAGIFNVVSNSLGLIILLVLALFN